MAKAFEGNLLDELLAGTLTNTEGVHSLAEITITGDKANQLWNVPDRTIRQQINMWARTISRKAAIKNRFQRLVDLGSTKVCSESRYFLYCIL